MFICIIIDACYFTLLQTLASLLKMIELVLGYMYYKKLHNDEMYLL